MTAPATPARVGELDSARGIASFVVVLHHVWMVVLPDQNTFPLVGYPVAGGGALATVGFWISVSPLRLLFSGHAAVTLFFVLSGFALTRALQDPRQGLYTAFLTRRIFRIYPPFAAAILFAAALSWLLQPQPLPVGAWPGFGWVNAYWTTPTTASMVLKHLAMISTAGDYVSLDSPMWTLVHELRISLVFPLVAAATLARPRAAVGMAVTLFVVLSITRLLPFDAADPRAQVAFGVSLLQTLRYVLFFVSGIVLASQAQRICGCLAHRPAVKPLLWAGVAVLLALPYTKGYTELAYGVGSFVALALCLESARARALLRNPALQWLGRISYSLYLVHVPVLLAMVFRFYGEWPMAVIVSVAVAVSLATAELFHRWVELPSAHLGRRMAARFQPA